MNIDKWNIIKDKVKEGFEIIDEGKEQNEEYGGTDIEFLEFRGPLGLMRLEFISRPLVLDKKTIYSNRIGSETKVEYVFDKNERSYSLLVLKWDNDRDEWIELNNKSFNI